MSKQMELGGTAEALQEYVVAGKAWRCGQFDLLAAEFGLQPEQLASFQALIATKERPWLIVRRLFGIRPVLIAPDYPDDDLRVWSRQDLMASLGITRPQLQMELEAVRGTWEGAAKPKSEGGGTGQRSPKSEGGGTGQRSPKAEFEFAEEDLLARHGFRIKFPDLEGRSWFATRVKAYEKLLGEPSTAGLARNALMTELQLYQLDCLLADPEKNRVGSGDWRSNMKVRGELDATYLKQTAQINDLAPWASALTGKYSFTGVLSDVTRAICDYQAREDTRLIDGILTAMEIRVECRRSVQMPNPRYRAGLIVYLQAARAGLWDPHWKNPFEPAELKKLDRAWAEAAVAAGNESGEKVPDLTKDGEEGEYEELAKGESVRA
jgi:hypothetical protein